MRSISMRSVLLGSSLFIALPLAACGGGGGAGNAGGITTPAPPPVTVTPPPAPTPTTPADPNPPIATVAIPERTSREYSRNWGLADTGVYAAWEQGATGKGVTVAVVDTGVNTEHPDLAVNISGNSIDINGDRNTLYSGNNHGSRVASVIAAPFNGTGTVGMAYNASILAIRADTSDCSESTGDVCFRNGDLARSLDYAVANGARIINLSLGGDAQMNPQFEAALQRAVDAGVIFAISAGNNQQANPGWPGRYAVDPRFAGSIIVVGAHNNAGDLANFSNKAGVGQDAYLSAPGENVVVDCIDTSCWALSGTSFAAPAVAASMALLKEAFPNLTGQEIVDILLRSARDAGAAGTDEIRGRGELDVARAFQPIGATFTPAADGQKLINAESQMSTYLGSPFGDAMSLINAMTTIAYDEYDRLFTVNMAQNYRVAPRRSYQPAVQTPMVHSEVATFGPAGSYLKLAAALPQQEPEAILPRHGLTNAPWMGDEERREALFEVQMDRLSFAAWQGVGGMSSPFQTGSADGFAALAQSDHAIRGTYMFGQGNGNHIIVSADAGSGDRRMPLQQVEQNASNYARVGFGLRNPNGGVSLSFGSLDERMGPLGSYMPSRSDLALPSKTQFTGIGGDMRLNERLTLTGEAGMGRTEINGSFLQMSKAAISSTWKVGLQAACSGWTSLCSSLSWEVSQPLRIESGRFEANLADVPLDYFDPVTFSRRSFSAAPSGREINMTMRSVHRLGDNSTLQLEATAIREEQHRRDAKPGYAFVAMWRSRF